MTLATAPTMASKREALMKQREKERLERLLALMFGYRYPLHWTARHTSYFDGKACYVKYDVQTEEHRTFTVAEQRVIRQHHAFHERGHEYFDVLEDYRDWIKEMSSADFKDWEENEKYPRQWVQFFGNTGMDGRMELLVTSAFPTQEDFFEFGNYEWRFGIRGEKAGEDIGQDFQECFMHRVLDMEDIEEWDVEAVNLVDVVQDDIERLRRAATTKDCLDITSDIMKKVWPQLWEWMDIQEPEEMVIVIPGTPIDDHDDEEASWSSREDAEERAERALKKAGITPSRSSNEHEGKKDEETEFKGASEVAEDDSTSSEGESTQDDENGISDDYSDDNSEDGDENNSDSTDGTTSDKTDSSEPNTSTGDEEDSDEATETPKGEEQDNEAGDGSPSREEKLQQLLDSIEQQLEKEQEEMDSQNEPFETRQENVEIQDQRKNISDTVTITEYPRSDLSKYSEVKSQVSSQIGPFGRAMKQMLEGNPDQHRRNQKKGRLRVNSVWKAQRCENVNIFDRTIKGTPAKNAVVFSQFDNSGSTWGEVVVQMQKAAVLITEGCAKANVPHYSYAFTEEGRDSLIFPLKPTDKLTNREKGYIGGMEALSGNRDTLVLQWTVDQIAKRPEDIKLLIMVSDGLPIFEAGIEDETTMRNIVLNAEKKGIDVLCLFVGDHRPDTVDKVRYMYNNHVISVESNVAREMQKQVKRIIRKRRD